MELRIGIVGTGAIGREHIKLISEKITDAKVAAVTDINENTAKETAAKYGAVYYTSPDELIESDVVDAIMVTSSDDTHAQYVLKGLRVEKPVFCEKPLASNPEDARKVVEAEMSIGKHLVQVGFMRRYDAGYRQLKSVIDEGKIGAPLMLHCVHRNAHPGPGHTTAMNITNSAIHEMDVLRWLLGENYKSCQVILPKASSLCTDGLQDPQIILLETQSGVRIDVESFVSCQYGYDVQCTVVGELGTVSLPDPASAVIRKNCACSREIMDDWSKRFVEAYDTELRNWVDCVKRNVVEGPNAWDGYIASATAGFCTKAREEGGIVPIALEPTPEFYIKKSLF